MSEFAQYIGKAWESGAQGPEAYDCWGLLRHIQWKHFGKDLPCIRGLSVEERRDLHRDGLAREEWHPVSTPMHGDAALLRGGDSPHVGVYLDIDGGGILHSLEGVGVIFSKRIALAAQGYGRIQYYQL